MQLFVISASSCSGSGGDGNSGGSSNNNRSVYARGDLARALLYLAPLLRAAMIAISCCQDYRHNIYRILDEAAGNSRTKRVAQWRQGLARHDSGGSTSPACIDPR